jgi:hypothetical protein
MKHRCFVAVSENVMDIGDAVKKIRANSDLVIEQLGPLSGIAFGLNRQSVEWVDGFIERQRMRDDLTDEFIARTVNVLGSFIGECVIAHTDGAWAWIEEQQTIGVRFPSGSCTFPFTKVHKQYLNGNAEGDSISGFFCATLSLREAGML